MRAWTAESDLVHAGAEACLCSRAQPVEMLWSTVKTRESADVASDRLADVADTAERGSDRVCEDDRFLGPSSLTPGWRYMLCPHTAKEKRSKR